MYTLVSLEEYNRHKREYPVTERDLEIVNNLLVIFSQNLQSPEPTPGDLIICHGYNSHTEKEVVHDRGVIDEIEGSSLHICVKPQPPHVRINGATVTSGGYWFASDRSGIKRANEPTGERTFWCWGAAGARAHAGLNFQSLVKAWYVTSHKIY